MYEFPSFFVLAWGEDYIRAMSLVLGRPWVLIVDDSAAVRGAIRDVVQARTRFGVCEAGDGHTAIQVATENFCDLVLLDIAMPPPDGVETAVALRDVLPNTKIIGFSALSKQIGEGLVAKGNFDAFLSKLDGLTKLVETLNSFIPGPPFTDWATWVPGWGAADHATKQNTLTCDIGRIWDVIGKEEGVLKLLRVIEEKLGLAFN